MKDGDQASSGSSFLTEERFIRFEPYRFDRVGGLLSKDGIESVLPPRAARLLACLLEDPGKVVPKDVLIAAVWDGTAVSDQSLAEAISQLRHALQDDPHSPAYIQTVHRRGYRFLAQVAAGQPEVSSSEGLVAAGEIAGAAGVGISESSVAPHRRGLSLFGGVAGLAVLVVGGVFLVQAWFEQQRTVARHENEIITLQRRASAAFPGSHPTIDIVWEQASVTGYGASPSPDGEFIAYGGPGEAPSIYRIDTGETIRLAREEDPPINLVSAGPIFSPDSRRIAYIFWDEWGEEEAELRIVGTDDLERTTIQRGAIARPLAWTPDGRYLVARRGLEIVRVSVDDGSSTTLQTLRRRGPGGPGRLALSPDGSMLAYDSEQADGSGQRDIWVLSLEDGAESLVVQHPMNDLYPMWTPDGTGILFISDRSDNYAVWVVGVAGGEVEGPGPLASPSSMIWPLGLGDDGSLFYGVGSGTGSDLYIAALEPRTLAGAGAPTQVVPAFPGFNLGPTWSPDGTQLAYVSQRGLVMQPDTVIVISSVSGSQGRRLNEIVPGLRYMRNPRWSPDGRSILVHGYDAGMVWGIYLIDVASGEATPLLQDPGHPDTLDPESQWLPDGSGIVFGRGYEETGVQTLSRWESVGGSERELHRTVQPNAREGWALSPDGSELAVSVYVPEENDSWRVVLWLIPVAGGTPEELMSVSSPFTITNLAWAPGGERILFIKKRGDLRQERQIWAVDRETGEPEPLEISLPGIRDIAFDPGGTRIAFAAHTQTPSTQVWVLRNFLPAPSASGDGGSRAPGSPPRH